jgi:hypothetical protein
MARSEAAVAATETLGGRFHLQRRLARGSSGEVFLALDRSTGKRVALKRLLPSTAKASALSFMREFHALSGLQHPRIIEVYDYGVDAGAPYYTMELLEGHDLSELSPLPYREACGYLRDTASSLALLHARRLLHRDVSPRNLRRGSDGRCKLIDFGAMIPFGTPPNVIGTPPCLAPEAFQGGPLDQTSDLYSLGAVAYFLLTGRHAYPARELSALPALWRHGIPPLQAASEIPQALEQLVMALLSLDPARRPASAAEVIERLSAIAGLTPEDDRAIGRSVLASTPLLGRMRERAAIDERLRKTKAGQGSALIMTGESGMGRTRMLTEASLLAQTHGLAVVRLVLREQRGLSSSLVRELLSGLMQVVPKEAERASAALPRVQTADSAALLRQVEGYVSEIAAQQPLLLTFDDVHFGNDHDAALIAALAQRTNQHSLCVIASERGPVQASRLAHLSDFSAALMLPPLDRAQTAMLSSALFGDVPNLQYISELFFRTAQGNPKLTLELAKGLLARGTLSYAAGSWVLPDEISEPMPRDIAQTLLLRLEWVGPEARSLADLLCVRRRGARIEQLIELAAPLSAEHVLRALEELVGAGVLQSAGDEYAFIQDALRVELDRALAPTVSRELHLRWANFLLGQAATEDARLEAGWHLVHTADELRGAELLAEVAPALVEQRVNMAAAIPAIERALHVYERHDKALSTRLYLRALLVMSSYLYDYRLADRYADETLDLLYPYTGLPEAERCARWLGRSAGFVVGTLWAMARRLLRPVQTRGPSVIAAIKYYAQSTMGLMGLRALTLGDTQSILDRMRLFQGAPHPTLALLYELSRAIHLHALGRGADARRSIQRAWAQLERKHFWQLSAHDRRDLQTGLLLLEGINETWREHSRTLACADELERVGTPLAVACSLRVRVMFYLLRGDPEQARNYRRLLELKAVESGSLWQVQLFAAPIEGLAGATWHDLIGMRRALERMDQLFLEAPDLAPLRDTTLIPYHFRRGDFDAAVQVGEDFMRRFPPMTRIGWSMAYAVVALAHVHLGRPERALEICESALAHVSPDDREFVVFYAPLEGAYAVALAAVGRSSESARVFSERLERLRATGDLQRAVVMHHYRVALARLTGDRDALQAALQDMHETAVASGNPATLALAQRLSDERPSSFELPAVTDDLGLAYSTDELPPVTLRKLPR